MIVLTALIKLALQQLYNVCCAALNIVIVLKHQNLYYSRAITRDAITHEKAEL